MGEITGKLRKKYNRFGMSELRSDWIDEGVDRKIGGVSGARGVGGWLAGLGAKGRLGRGVIGAGNGV
jgi:hypothetical protein